MSIDQRNGFIYFRILSFHKNLLFKHFDRQVTYKQKNPQNFFIYCMLAHFQSFILTAAIA